MLPVHVALIIRDENPAHFMTAQWPFQPRLKFLVTSYLSTAFPAVCQSRERKVTCYSVRIAVIGSTRVARSAGSQQAMRATTANANKAKPNAGPSNPPTP